MGVLWMAIAAPALSWTSSFLFFSFSVVDALAALAELGGLLLGLVYVLRSRVTVEVIPDGLHQISLGRWHLKWTEIRRQERVSAGIVVEPTAEALQRQSIRTAVQWSRYAAAGGERGVIVLPHPLLDCAAVQALQTHEVGIR